MINWQVLQAQLPVLDEYQLQRMDQTLGTVVIERLLRLFIEDSQQLDDRLQQAYQQSDFMGMAAHCHSLKSACGSYGALRCQYVSEKLEESCQLQDEEVITLQISVWQTALAATLEAVKERLTK
ncbi:Hpt domain-containing protein [Oceanisphaera pacifica]|uniref:Hpt domain-containing protein n=1 Tax=Oceanisphaera pacifica TaxID=2818389 RepID=A0ABS3NEN3_9GAMM|nr:Hpt domain-containing protein [Oceanisphaera pacifica]MBO1519037.1 Hpt domain-containing protein [Oceanisphaera pacifica]